MATEFKHDSFAPTRLMATEFEHDSFARRQDSVHKRIEESLAKLIAAVTGARAKEPPDPVATPTQGWSLPPSVTKAPLGVRPESLPWIRLEPPRFDGEHALDWIDKIQRYYNHHYTPLDDRLYLAQYLFDHPASDWREYWVETNKGKSWDDFLLAVEQRFDPEFYKPSAVTASPRQFMGTRRTVRDQRKPNRDTAYPVADREPDQQLLQRQKEVTQVSDVSQFGAHPLNAISSNIFANVSSSKSIVCDENMIVNTGSTNTSVINELGFETIIGDENFGTNSTDGDEDGDTVIKIAVDCGQPMMEIIEVDSFLRMDSSNSYTELEFSGVKTELRLQNCEVDDENNDGSLSVGSEQYIQDPKYAAPPTPLFFCDEMMSCLKLHSTLHGMRSCLVHHSLLSIENRDWFTMVHALASDGRSIPPREHLGRKSSRRRHWRLPHSQPPHPSSSFELLRNGMADTDDDSLEFSSVVCRRCIPSYYTIYLEERREYKLHEDELGKDFVRCVAFFNKVRILFQITLLKFGSCYTRALEKCSCLNRFGCQMMNQLQYNVQEFRSRCWGNRSCITYVKVLSNVMIFITWCCMAMALNHDSESSFDTFGQGAQGFKNAMIGVFKLQHNNLVQSLEYGVKESLDFNSHSHLEDKVVLNGGGVDRVLDLANLVEDISNILAYLLF